MGYVCKAMAQDTKLAHQGLHGPAGCQTGYTRRMQAKTLDDNSRGSRRYNQRQNYGICSEAAKTTRLVWRHKHLHGRDVACLSGLHEPAAFYININVSVATFPQCPHSRALAERLFLHATIGANSCTSGMVLHQSLPRDLLSLHDSVKWAKR